MDRNFGPYLEIARIQSEMNRLFDVLLDLRDGESGPDVNAWIPSVDVSEGEGGLILKAELPGVPASSLKVTAISGALVIAGERTRNQPEEGVKFHCMERVYGRFRRVIPLGLPFTSRGASASLRNGILEVCFLKVPNRRGEVVEIPVVVMEGGS